MADGSSHTFTEARLAGLSPIPVDTTSKRPLVRWATFQEEPPDELQCAEWDQAGHNIAVVCGRVSGRLICLDFEAAFLEHSLMLPAEVAVLLSNWRRGYCESTPSGGFHILIRLEGSGPTEGNRKLAMRDGKVLVETRAEGGYTIIAPSRNGTRGWELIKGGLSSIPYITAAEWQAVVAALTALDESPPPLARESSTSTTMPAILRLGESWIDEAKAFLPPIEDILVAHGWQPARSRDSFGQHWVRPDKDPSQGHSASLSEAGYLHVHSTNAGLPVGVAIDGLDVILFYELGRMPSLEERTGYLRRTQRVAPPSAEGVGPAGPVAEPNPALSSLNLPPEFWESRSVLSAIFEVARARNLAPDGVLGAFLSAYATTIPMNIWIPGIVARRAPLNIFSCLVARSGGGKTGAMGVALDLLGWNINNNPHVLLNQSLRSGEGLPRLVVIPPAKGSDGAPSFNNAVQISFDEGGTLGKQSERAGSTIIPYLNTAWAGSGTVGGAKAGEIVQFPAELVRICAVMGVQYGAAANLFTGEAAALGFPQRLLYFGMRAPDLAHVDVDEMDSSPVQPLQLPFWEHSEFSRTRLELEVPANIQREVRVWSRDKDHGAGIDDPLDGHQMNLSLRVAGVLALMDGRGAISPSDWETSSQVVDNSRRVRQSLILSLGEKERLKVQARIDEAIATADALDSRGIRKQAARISAWAAKFPDGVSMKEIKGRLDQRERQRRDDIVEYAIRLGWVIHRDGRYFAGPSMPRTPVG